MSEGKCPDPHVQSRSWWKAARRSILGTYTASADSEASECRITWRWHTIQSLKQYNKTRRKRAHSHTHTAGLAISAADRTTLPTCDVTDAVKCHVTTTRDVTRKLYCLRSLCTLRGRVNPLYTVFQKPSPLMFDNNFGKCGPIFKILSPGDL